MMKAQKRHTEAGLTLIELMVAITIGLIITAAVAQIYVSSRTSYVLEEGMARVQENGRFAIEFLAYDLRMAGYAGCNSQLPASAVNNIVQGATAATTFNPAGISGHRYTGTGNTLADWTPALPAGFFTNGEVQAGTDVIIVQYASPVETNLTGNMGVVNANIQVLSTSATASNLAAGEVVMISDCQSADVFRATNVSSGSGTTTIAHSNSGNTTNNLSKSYTTNAQIMELVSRAYYIGNGSSQRPALFRKDIDGTPQELVEGIETMRFRYAEDTDVTFDGVPDVYLVPTATTPNWSNVVGVRIGVLSVTPAQTTFLDQNTYELAGDTIGPMNDNFRRHAFNTTVRLRN